MASSDPSIDILPCDLIFLFLQYLDVDRQRSGCPRRERGNRLNLVFYAVLASLWKSLCKVLANMCRKTSDIERTSACSLSAEALGDRE